MNVSFSFLKGPTTPGGPYAALIKAETGEKCLKCPNSLICFSRNVGVEQCQNCMRVYVDGNIIPRGICCEGLGEDFHFHTRPRECVTCAEEYVNECFREALAPFIGIPNTPGTRLHIQDSIRHIVNKIAQIKGWEIEAKLEDTEEQW